MHKYNNHFPDDATPDSLLADREAMLQSTFGKVGKGAFIEPPINIDYGCNITIGENFYSNFKYLASRRHPWLHGLTFLQQSCHFGLWHRQDWQQGAVWSLCIYFRRHS